MNFVPHGVLALFNTMVLPAVIVVEMFHLNILVHVVTMAANITVRLVIGQASTQATVEMVVVVTVAVMAVVMAVVILVAVAVAVAVQTLAVLVVELQLQ